MSHSQKGYEAIKALRQSSLAHNAAVEKVEALSRDYSKLVKDKKELEQQCKEHLQNIYEKENELKQCEDKILIMDSKIIKAEDLLKEKEQEVDDLAILLDEMEETEKDNVELLEDKKQEIRELLDENKELKKDNVRKDVEILALKARLAKAEKDAVDQHKYYEDYVDLEQKGHKYVLDQLTKENVELKEKINQLRITNNNKKDCLGLNGTKNPRKRRRTEMTSSADENGQNSEFER